MIIFWEKKQQLLYSQDIKRVNILNENAFSTAEFRKRPEFLCKPILSIWVQENICEVVSHNRFIPNHNQNAQQPSVKKIEKMHSGFYQKLIIVLFLISNTDFE